MKLLADENIHADLVVWLRSTGHDVLYAAEVLRQVPDDELLAIARAEGRVIFTDDKDFGELVFRQQLATAGVILVRLFRMSLPDRIARLAQVWDQVERAEPGGLVVIEPANVRVRPAP